MLFATSCSDEELTYESASKQNVSFKIQVEGADVGSRTIADGTNDITIGKGQMVNKLFYAVYETGSTECLMEGEADVNNGLATVVIPLVNGLHFDLVFLAYNNENNIFGIPKTLTFSNGLCADVDLENLTLRSDLKANQEAYDAFYHMESNYVTNTNSTSPVTLRRMLAQLNVATTDNDLSQAKQLKADITHTAIELSGVPNEFNARTGVASGETTVSYGVSDILKCSTKPQEQVHENEQLKVNIDGVDKNFNYLAMAYVLANKDESSLHDTKVSFYRTKDSNVELVHTRTIPTLPIQRQFRTNVTGNVLTQQEAFNISLDVDFGNKNESVGDVVVAGNLADLQAAINNAQPGVPVEIQLGADIILGSRSSRATDAFTSGIIIPADKNIIFDLNNFTLSYTSGVIHEAMITNNGTLTIKNGTVTYNYTGETDTSYGKGNYAINNAGTLVIDANINAVAGSEGMKFSHAFYAINTSGKTTINGGKIHNKTNYAIRQWVSNETNSSDITVNGGEIEGLRAIWIQLPSKDTSKAPKGNLTVNGGKLTGTAIDGTQDSGNVLAIYATSEGNQMKNVEININGGDIYGDLHLTGGRKGAKVDVEKVTITGGTFHNHDYEGADMYNVKSWADDALAAEAITITGGNFSSLYPLCYMGEEESASIKLSKSIELSEGQSIPVSAKVTLDLNGKTITGTDNATSSFGLINLAPGSNLTIKSTTAEGKITLSATNNRVFNAYSSVVSNQRATLTVGANVVIEHLGGTDMAYGIDNLTNTSAEHAKTTIDGATIKSTYRAIRQFLNSSAAGVNNELYVKSGIIEGDNKSIWMQDTNASANPGKLVVDANAQLKGDVWLSVAEGSTEWPVEISIAMAALQGDSKVLTNEFVPENLIIAEKNGIYTITSKPVVATIGGESYYSFDDAVDAAIKNDITEIVLAEGEYKLPSKEETAKLTIKGTKETVIDVTLGSYWDNATLTIEGVTIKTNTGYANGNGSDYAALYSKNVTYTNVTFVGPMRVGRDGAKFINCTFTELGNDYVWTYGNDVTFEGCTFNTDGKAILIYSDGGNEVSQVSVKNCKFNATTGAKAGAIANQNCAAIEIHNYGNGVNLTTSGNTVDNQNFSGEWRIKTYETGRTQVFVNGTEYTTIALDGKTMTIDANKNVTINE